MLRRLHARARPLLAALATAAAACVVGQALAADATAPRPPPPLYDGPGGVTCTHVVANALPWQRKGGDWRDARGTPHGPEPHAQEAPTEPATAWNVTTLVRERKAMGRAEIALFLRVVSEYGFAAFHSREATATADWPSLELQFDDGSRQVVHPIADTTIDCSTAFSVGADDKLVASMRHQTVLAFPLPEGAGGPNLIRADLVLVPAAALSGNVTIGVFEVLPPDTAAGRLRPGLARDFPLDRGIARHADVLFAARFDGPELLAGGWRKDSRGDMALVQGDPAIDGGALRIRIKEGAHLGSDLRLDLRDFGPEPDELYFRYYLRLAEDWQPSVADGKLPGFAGTYGKAGWGGRRSDGTKGWSLRGNFARSFQPGHPFAELTQVGTYAYHASMRGTYGDIWPWPGALLARKRWYCIEQFVRLNRVGVDDGILRVWIDGHQVFENTHLRLRNVDSLHIETVWMNVYHGGPAAAPQDMSLHIDNVVVARSYIGPMAEGPMTEAPMAEHPAGLEPVSTR